MNEWPFEFSKFYEKVFDGIFDFNTGGKELPYKIGMYLHFTVNYYKTFEYDLYHFSNISLKSFYESNYLGIKYNYDFINKNNCAEINRIIDYISSKIHITTDSVNSTLSILGLPFKYELNFYSPIGAKNNMERGLLLRQIINLSNGVKQTPLAWQTQDVTVQGTEWIEHQIAKDLLSGYTFTRDVVYDYFTAIPEEQTYFKADEKEMFYNYRFFAEFMLVY